MLPTIEQKFSNIKKESVSRNTLRLEINNIKVDFLIFNEIKNMVNQLNVINNWKLADSLDVGAMKIKAIISRGTRKDFIDLAFLLEKYTLNEIINAYKLKYNLNSDKQVIQYLIDFHEAELEGERSIILINHKMSWEETKTSIKNHLEKYLKQT